MCVFVAVTYSKMGRLWILSSCGTFIYILRYYINAGVTFFLKVGVPLDTP